ncbi:MAG: hypothetical protein KDD35_04215 [Bdellovibrionales bacterium]|nr:hypothetical protein [Bdellovibrionales bacterium]
MQKPEFDLLYVCLENHLHNFKEENETEEALIAKVLEDFAARILSKGHIPTQYLADLHQELEDELRDMLRKKIYGHWDIAHYRRQVITRRAL